MIKINHKMSEDKAEEGAANAEQIQEFKLGPDEELRFEVEAIKGQVVTAVVSIKVFNLNVRCTLLTIRENKSFKKSFFHIKNYRCRMAWRKCLELKWSGERNINLVLARSWLFSVIMDV